MSREIKFRVWDTERKQMIAVPVLSFGDDGSALTSTVWLRTPEGYDRGLVVGESGMLMQYTGVKDRTGKEIYEGDILSWPDGPPSEVEWSEHYAAWIFDEVCSTPDDDLTFGAVVIGNIYEHPHFLGPQP